MDDGEAASPQQDLRKQRYEGEDLSPTTTRELRGFYAYGLAAEVFAVCGVGSFLPVTLEQLARERGVLWSDKTTSCVAKTATRSAAPILKGLLVRASEDQNNQCVIRILGAEITTSSFAMYTFSLAVFVQALALVSFSAVADHGTYRKKLLLSFGFTGAISSMLFIFVVPQIFFVAPILVVIGVTCLGSSFVILNSFLPLLVANHPSTHESGGYEFESRSTPLYPISPESPGLQPRDSSEYISAPNASFPAQNSKHRPSDSPSLKLSTTISSRGVGIGYIAAVFVQILSILLLFIISKAFPNAPSTLPLRMVLLMSGVWWFVFTIPSSRWLKDRPGPPLRNTNPASQSTIKSILIYFVFAWASLFRTIRMALQLRQCVVFLVAWFLLSDAIATVSGTAILFARTELKMGTVAIALLSITATSSGIAGAFIWPMISRYFNLSANHTIICCICLMEIIPIYGLLGYLPFIRKLGFLGLQQAWEIYPLGFVHGFVMGGLGSYCRAMFGRLIPAGWEAAFYALYAITDKGSSALGPAVVGVIVDRTGSIRTAFIFLTVLVAIPGPIVSYVDVTRGVSDASALANRLNKIEEEELEEINRGGGFEREGLMDGREGVEED